MGVENFVIAPLLTFEISTRRQMNSLVIISGAGFHSRTHTPTVQSPLLVVYHSGKMRIMLHAEVFANSSQTAIRLLEIRILAVSGNENL